MRPLLKENGYCGYINLNTIVNESGIWPLEFTCRFGYPGYAILDPLQQTSLGRSVSRHDSIAAPARFETEPGFAVGIVVTTPPFPYSREHVPEPIGLPVLFEGDLSPEERSNVHYGEVGLKDGVLVTSGASGYTLVVTGTGDTVEGPAAGRTRWPKRWSSPTRAIAAISARSLSMARLSGSRPWGCSGLELR